MDLNPRCRMLIKRMVESFRMAKTDNVDPAKAYAEATRAVRDIATRPDLRESAATLIRNNFLSSTSTLIKNMAGNAARLLEVPLTRFASGLATADAKKIREAGDILVGYTKAFVEVFPRFLGGFSNKNIAFDGRTAREVDFYLKFPGQDATKELTTFDKALNTVVTFPQSLQRGVDEGFSAFFERAQYQIFLNRLKNSPNEDVLRRLGVTRDELVDRLEAAVTSKNAKGLRDVREERLFDAVAKYDPEAAKLIDEFAKYGTFRSSLGEGIIDQAASAWFKFGNKFAPELQALITPFIITPLNIAKFGAGFVPGLGIARMSRAARDIDKLKIKKDVILDKLQKASELKKVGLKKRLAEVEGEIKFKQQLKQDFIGQQLLGLGFTGWAYSMMQDGALSGEYPSDAATRTRMIESGIPPNSIRVGDRWISYSGIEPLHTVLSIFANGKLKADEQIRDGNKLASMETMLSVANVVKAGFADKTFTAQLAELMNATLSEDSASSGLVRLGVGMTNGLTPNLLNMVARLEDPIKRQVKDPNGFTWALNNIKSRIPGLRETLPEGYSSITGQPASLGTPAEIATGFRFAEINRTKLQKLFDNPQLKILPPSNKLYGIELTAEQYSAMSKQMGDLTSQVLDILASSEGFMSLPQSLQAKSIKDVIGSIRSDVRRATLGAMISHDSEAYRKFMTYEFTKKGLNPHTNPDIIID